jgi:hypothetical protein
MQRLIALHICVLTRIHPTRLLWLHLWVIRNWNILIFLLSCVVRRINRLLAIGEIASFNWLVVSLIGNMPMKIKPYLLCGVETVRRVRGRK